MQFVEFYSQILCSYDTINLNILQLGACNVSLLGKNIHM